MALFKKFENIIVHIGSHKTGSTSIQYYLAENQDHFGDVGIFCFDDNGKYRKVPNNNHLVEVYRQNGMILKKLNLKSLQHIKNLNTKNRIILSAENLFWIDARNQIEELKSHLDSLSQKVTIIVYLRRQDICAVSHKRQGCKTIPASLIYGHDLTALPSLDNFNVKRYFDYYSKISTWGDVFGDKNLVIRVFEQDLIKNGDVVSDFLDCCNIEYYSPKKSRKFNTSLSREKQLFLHEVISCFPEYPEEIRLLVSEIVRIDKRNNNENPSKLLPSKQEAYLFYNEFIEPNILLNQRFNISAKKSIFKDDFSFYPEHEDNFLDRTELIRIFSQVFKNVAFKKNVVTADFLRDVALKLESSNIDVATELMEKAYQLRPSGKFIQEKVLEYQAKAIEKNKKI